MTDDDRNDAFEHAASWLLRSDGTAVTRENAINEEWLALYVMALLDEVTCGGKGCGTDETKACLRCCRIMLANYAANHGAQCDAEQERLRECAGGHAEGHAEALRRLDEMTAARDKLAAAHPVMLTLLAWLADEASTRELRDMAIRYSDAHHDALDAWLDEHKRTHEKAGGGQ